MLSSKRLGLIVMAVAVAALAVVGPASAAVISYNFDNNGTVGGAGAGSGPHINAFAGVKSVGNWYNDFPSAPVTDLQDNQGNTTTLDIGWFSANGTWAINFAHPGVDGGGTWNQEMLNGYLNSGNGPVVGLDLKEIPFDKYNVYVYFSSDVAGREGVVTGKERDSELDPFINDESFYFSTNADVSAFTLATATSPTDPGDGDTADGDDPFANYAVFSGTLDYFNVETQIPSFGGIAGIQIVEVPEPASLALFGLGALLTATRRRR